MEGTVAPVWRLAEEAGVESGGMATAAAPARQG